MLQIRHYLLRMTAAALPGVLFWALFYPWRQRRRGERKLQPGPYREGALLLFDMFLAGLLVLVLTPPAGWAYSGPFQGTVNLIPIRESVRLFRFYLEHGMWTAIWVNFPGNILMFMPIGFFAGLLSDRPRWWKGTLWTFVLSLFIETAQLFVCRGTDVDDLVLNTLGGLLGYGCFRLLERLSPEFIRQCAKTQKGSG